MNIECRELIFWQLNTNLGHILSHIWEANSAKMTWRDGFEATEENLFLHTLTLTVLYS